MQLRKSKAPVRKCLINTLTKALAEEVVTEYQDDVDLIAEAIVGLGYEVIARFSECGVPVSPSLLAVTLKQYSKYMIEYYQEDNEHF